MYKQKQQKLQIQSQAWCISNKSILTCKVVNIELVQANELINLYSHTPGYRNELVEALYADYPALR